MTSLYVHLPFCRSKCLFCSFVIAVGKEHRSDSYLEALAAEAKDYRGQTIETIYLGGGTPTHMSIDQLARLFALIKKTFKYNRDAEFTIEANPEDIDPEKAKFLYGAGVNRISLGVQSLNDKYLSFLGRGHNREKALTAFHILKKAGFSNINLDLMFSFPGQTLEELEEDAHAIAALGSDHLSLYALTIEEGSRFFRQNMKLDDTEEQARAYTLITELLEKAGFRQYEISNFAKDGKESKHNRMYWEGGDYIGLGIGAHSHQDGRRFWNISSLSLYLEKTKAGLSPVEGSETLDNEKKFMETLLFGLRMNEGVEIDSLLKRYGVVLSPERKKKIAELTREGFFIEEKNRLCTTLKGRLLLDEISVQLI